MYVPDFKGLADHYGFTLITFDSKLFDRDGFLDKPTQTILLSDAIKDPYKAFYVVAHELGHKDHYTPNYDRLRDKYEIQADKFAITCIVEECLKLSDLENLNAQQIANAYGLTKSHHLDQIEKAIKGLYLVS